MTATVTLAEATARKTCANPECERPFGPFPGQRMSSWAITRYCSSRCTPSKRGKGIAPLPVPPDPPLIPDVARVDVSWQARAACRDEDPELFQTVATKGPAYELQVADAKAVCHRCPALDSCRSWALSMGRLLEHGIVAGLTADERDAIIRRRAS